MDDLEKYQTSISKIASLTQEEVIKKLRCSVPCTHQEYSIHREADRFKQRDASDTTDYSSIGFMIKDGAIDITHETPMYDENDFISDFGGMMGLLLGASVLSLYELLAELLKKCYAKIFLRDPFLSF